LALSLRLGRPWTLRRWRRARRGVQLLTLAAFIGLFVGARRGGLNPELANIPMRLDPLLVLAHLLASHVFVAGSALALVTVALTLVFGRAWCGWLCPLGTAADLFPLRPLRSKRPAPREGWRGVKYALLLAILVAAIFSNLTLLVLDPLTIVFRSLSASLWPAVDALVTAAEAMVYQVPWLQAPLSELDALVRPAILPTSQVLYRDALLYALVLGAVVGLNVFAERFWCRYLCPLGGLLGLMSKVSLFKRVVARGQCTDCDACARICPTGAIQSSLAYASDPGECTMCLDCLAACPRDGNLFSTDLTPAGWNTYNPGRRQALAVMGATVAGVFLLRSDLSRAREHPHLIRPPGARENNLLSKCIRCGECVRACPTSAIQPSLAEAGAEGLWTPVLVPRAGYCDYSCNACGQACPVLAIPPLNLEEKRQQLIGAAYINQNRCIAWSNHKPCIVCEEMCPLPEKAIWLEELKVPDGNGAMVNIQMPHVNRDRCIGCGICEYKCPVNGEAAIRVYVPGNSAPVGTG
jgi:MauM/NapG family ferredoxin protein